MSGTFGWIPDLPDQRDLRYEMPLRLSPLPPSVDLRAEMPPVYNQGTLGSCTAQAIAAAIEHGQRRQGIAEGTPSRLFVYWNARARIGTTGYDSGSRIRDGVKSVAKEGECDEALWPYDIMRFRDRPAPECYAAGKGERVLRYRRLSQSLVQMQHCLAAGLPFVFGFTVYDSFLSSEVARTGVAEMPGADESTQGGHAVMAVGYENATRRFLVRNSWGAGWGRAGYFTMPYDYLLDDDLAADFWALEKVQ